MKHNRVLIVATDESLGRMLEGLLQAKGYFVKIVENGWQALENMACASFSIILMNSDVSVVARRELTRALRKQYVRTPVLLTSAHMFRDPAATITLLTAVDRATRGMPLDTSSPS